MINRRKLLSQFVILLGKYFFKFESYLLLSGFKLMTLYFTTFYRRFNLLPHLNEFRTVKWQDLFDFPETSLNQMRQLLDQPEWVA